MNRRLRRVNALEGYELWAKSYDDTPNPVVALDRRCSVSTLRPESGELILDAGCGTGGNSELLRFAGAIPVGIDFSIAMLKVAWRRLRTPFLAAADLQRPLPFRSDQFDATLCALVGEHLEHLPFTFRELSRVTRTGGRILFSVFHPSLADIGVEANFQQDDVEYRLGAMQYSVGDYLGMIEAAGFASIRFEEHLADEALVSSVSAAEKHLGRPMLLTVSGSKAGPVEAQIRLY